jgi:hypothetical protein
MWSLVRMIIENLAATREIDDEASASHTPGIVTIGTLAGVALGTTAPMTVYVGHTAFPSARRALGLRRVHGAAALRHVVGLLPRRHLNSCSELARNVVVAIPVVTAAFVSSSHPLLAWIARGGGLTAVGWSFLCFSEPRTRAPELAAWAMAAASLAGIVHAQPFSITSGMTALAYAAVALVARRTALRHSATMRG